MSSARETVEEVMVGDGIEDFEDSHARKWALLDFVVLVAMSALLMLIAFLNRNEILNKQLDLFVTMLLFLLYQLVSYALVFLISVIIYFVFYAAGQLPRAYRLQSCYAWTQHAIEVTILLYCAIHGMYVLNSGKLKSMIYHQLFFIVMIFVIFFKLLRLLLHYFNKKSVRAPDQLLVYGTGMFRVRNPAGPSNPIKTEVVDMMDNFKNSKLVKDDEKIQPGELEMYPQA